MSVSVHVVTWNSEPFLPAFFKSLMDQTMSVSRILVVDNASTDGTLKLLGQWPGIHRLRNTRNLGYSRAHNQAIALSRSDFVLVTNPDLILEPTCIEELVKGLYEHSSSGSACPKLLRFSFSAEGDLREPMKSDTIDAAGFVVRRSRQFLNRGEGRKDEGQYDVACDVFGAPGVLALYRRTALDDVAVSGEYFDEDFFAYKEDADLAWRLQRAGWTTRYVPTARAFHHRTLIHHGDRVDAILVARSKRSPILRRLSYRNHLLTLAKNESLGTLLPHLPFILSYELRKLGFMLLREWSTLPGIKEAVRLLPRILRKRRALQDRVRVSSASLRRLFVP